MGSATRERITAWDAEAVTEFTAVGADILVLPRPPLASLGPGIEAGRIHDYLAPIRRETAAREVRFGLGEFRIHSPVLAADIASLAIAFLDQFDLQQARLRIEMTRSQACPKFHCDNVNVRLVTTYFGPTSEYQYAGEDDVQIAPLHGLVFLKGYKHPTHRNGVHHRSPEVPAGEKRLCVAIDY